jgi:hypothetical protein
LVCITINLYSFILYILNILKKKFIKKKLLPGDKFGRYFKHSPTTLPTALIRWHLTVAATFTDEFTDGYIRSVCHTLTDSVTDENLLSVNHDITDGIKICQYISSGKFFFRLANSVCKTIGKLFFCFTDGYSDEMRNHRRKKS